MIIDAQVHLWPANTPDHPWPEGVVAHLDEPMTAERFLPLMDEIGVDRAIISPPFMTGWDPAYALECAAKYPDRFGITAHWSLDGETDRSLLPTWLDQPGMLGIRFALPPNDINRWRESGLLAQFWADCAEYNIPLMIFSPAGIAEVEIAARTHPNLRLIVDHINLVGPRDISSDERIGELVALGQYPNVGVKLGALPVLSRERYPFSDLHHHLQRVYRAFGARRLMWGSDQTMAMAHNKATYRENIDLIREAALGYIPAADIEWILGRTASEWFNWPF